MTYSMRDGDYTIGTTPDGWRYFVGREVPFEGTERFLFDSEADALRFILEPNQCENEKE